MGRSGALNRISTSRRRPASRVIVATAALAALMGCASARVGSSELQADPNTLARPSVLLVYDFAVTADDLTVDALGTEFASGEASKNLDRDHQVARDLSAQIVAQLQERGIHAEWASDTRQPPASAIAFRGQFLNIDEGSRLKRMVIGFGAGNAELRVRVQVYQAGTFGLRRIVEAEANTTGSKMPGMAVPVGVGAAVGRAGTSAVVSGGMNIATEVRGRMSADIARLAGVIADRTEAFYRRQGWL